jgi:quercetin dioxygenase-like cupin family protein
MRFKSVFAFAVLSLLALQPYSRSRAQAVAPAAPATAAPAAAAVMSLLSKDLVGVPGKELILLTVEYIPGGASLPHRHDAQVFVYVLEGEVVMQVKGSPVLHLHPGDTFYESPTDIHSVSANASQTSPAKILVFMVKNKGAPASRPAP